MSGLTCLLNVLKPALKICQKSDLDSSSTTWWLGSIHLLFEPHFSHWQSRYENHHLDHVEDCYIYLSSEWTAVFFSVKDIQMLDVGGLDATGRALWASVPTLTTLTGELGRRSRAHVDAYFPLASSVSSQTAYRKHIFSAPLLGVSTGADLISRALWGWWITNIKGRVILSQLV